MQQARHHGAVAVVAFGVVGGKVDLAGVGQRRAAGGDRNRRRAILARDVRRIHQVARAARVADDDRAIARAEHGRAHHLHVSIAGADAGDAQSKELVLTVLRHDAGVAGTIEFDALAGLPGGGDGQCRALECGGAGGIAVLQKGRHGVVHHLDQHIVGLVVGVHTAVNEGHAFAHAAREFEFEIGEAVITHAAAKTHHRGFAHVGTRGQFTHRQMRKRTRIVQYQLRDALLGRRERGQRCGDSV